MENSPNNEDNILDFRECSDGTVEFKINEETELIDILRTLNYFNIGEEVETRLMENLLEKAISEKNAFANREIIVAEEQIATTDQASIRTTIRFGENPTIDDVRTAYTKVYGEEKAPAMLKALTERLITEGYPQEVTIRITPQPKKPTATAEDIAREMQKMAKDFYGRE